MASNENFGFKTLWHSAGIPGLVLAAISVAYLVCNAWLNQANAVWAGTLNLVLEAVKIFACIWMMFFFMKKFKADNENAGKRDVRNFGTMTALLSSIVVAGVTMVFYKYNPELLDKTYEAIMQSAGPMMDDNAMQGLEMVMNNFPTISFFSTLVYCFLFGWILSCIMAGKVVSNNPFEDNESE